MIGAVPRAAFVPSELASRAYHDVPVAISHGQVTTQPSLVAKMVEAASLRGDERVLEIGTGFGYATAVLAELARQVWSVELWPDMADFARGALRSQGIANVHLVVGDGTLGIPDEAPFEAIVVNAAFPEVPGPLAPQLVEGGRLVQPIGPGGAEDVILFRKQGKRLKRERRLVGAHFVPLYGRHGYALENAPAEP